ncbi:hypothetical protein BaRGS_00029876 [Batillaria attramentaria]|uniref:Secreted protein n=1 Tax=Batillaria attramentaria TaxID=370345 RepID=A0ABD0JUX2_9CAEN
MPDTWWSGGCVCLPVYGLRVGRQFSVSVTRTNGVRPPPSARFDGCRDGISESPLTSLFRSSVPLISLTASISRGE